MIMKMLSTGKFSLGKSLKKVHYKCHKPLFIFQCVPYGNRHFEVKQWQA